MGRFLLTLSSLLLLAVTANATVRTVMEGTQATNNSIFISTGPSANPGSVYVRTAGSMTVEKQLGVGGKVGLGTLIPPTTVELDVVGILRTSSGVVTQGGNTRGANANDLQVTRLLTAEVASGVSSTISGGQANKVTTTLGSVCGGYNNYVIVTGDYSSICGGDRNTVSSAYSHIGGGSLNSIGANTGSAVIGGGLSNTLDDISDPTQPSVIAGGRNNTANNSSAIGGGRLNSSQNSSTIAGGVSNNCPNQFCAIGGGQSNTAAGSNATIGGGNSNSAAGQYSVVPGGLANSAGGISSFAAGRRASATAQGAFALADFGPDATFTNSVADSFQTRFAGGYYFTGGVSTFTSVIVEGNLTAGSITGSITVPAGSIDTTKLATDAVTTIKILDANVTSGKIASAAIDTTKLATDAVTGVKILNATIDTAKLNATIQAQLALAGTVAAGAIDTTKLATDAVTTIKILDASVTNGKLANGSVDTAKLATDAVTTLKILDASVTTLKLASASVDTTKISGGAVNNSKILDAAVDTAKIATDAVTTIKIKDANVTTAKIAAGAVDTGKLATDAVTTIKIIDAAVDTTKLATDAVTTVKIKQGAVDTTKLGDGSVTTVKINTGAVDTTKLATDSVTTIKILDANITTAKLAALSVDTGKLATDSVTNAKILSSTIDTSKLSPTGGTDGQYLGRAGGIIAWGTPSGGSSSSSGTVGFQSDNFISQANGVTKSFTLSATPQSSSAVWVVLDGLLMSGTSDYSLSGAVVTMTTAPATGSSSFFVQYAVNLSSGFVLAITSAAIIPAGSTTQTTFLVAHGTITFTPSGKYDLVCWLSADIKNSSLQYCNASYLINGGFGDRLSASVAKMGCYDAAGAAHCNVSFKVKIRKEKLIAGANTFAIAFVANAATCSWPTTAGSVTGDVPEFGCSEVFGPTP